MAQFKEVTLTGGEKITINTNKICTIQRFRDSTTTIHFSKDYTVHVQETPADILAESIDGRL